MRANNTPEAKQRYFATQKQNYLIRAKMLYELAIQYYEPGNHSKSLKVVWRTKVQPVYGMTYRTFLCYLHRAWEAFGGEGGTLKPFAMFDKSRGADEAEMR